MVVPMRSVHQEPLLIILGLKQKYWNFKPPQWWPKLCGGGGVERGGGVPHTPCWYSPPIPPGWVCQLACLGHYVQGWIEKNLTFIPCYCLGGGIGTPDNLLGSMRRHKSLYIQHTRICNPEGSVSPSICSSSPRSFWGCLLHGKKWSEHKYKYKGCAY